MTGDMNWKTKKVLITGASGFIGSHFTEKLISIGANVRAFIHYNSRGEDGNLIWISPELRNEIDFFYGDLRELETVNVAVKGIDVIFKHKTKIGLKFFSIVLTVVL